MGFIKYYKPQIGDKVKTTKLHSNSIGYLEIGTEVIIIDIGDRGYDIEDLQGNRMREIGWTI